MNSYEPVPDPNYVPHYTHDSTTIATAKTNFYDTEFYYHADDYANSKKTAKYVRFCQPREALDVYAGGRSLKVKSSDSFVFDMLPPVSYLSQGTRLAGTTASRVILSYVNFKEQGVPAEIVMFHATSNGRPLTYRPIQKWVVGEDKIHTIADVLDQLGYSIWFPKLDRASDRSPRRMFGWVHIGRTARMANGMTDDQQPQSARKKKTERKDPHAGVKLTPRMAARLRDRVTV